MTDSTETYSLHVSNYLKSFRSTMCFFATGADVRTRLTFCVQLDAVSQALRREGGEDGGRHGTPTFLTNLPHVRQTVAVM